MKILCIIPARGGSKGIPKKNLVNFCGKPLLQWTIEQAKGSTLINDIVVSSDSSEILNFSDNLRIKSVRRPPHFADDKSPSELALCFTLETYNQYHYHPDLIVFLQATSPLRSSLDIDNAINELIKNNYDSLFSACPIRDFLIWEKGHQYGLRPLNYDVSNRQRRQDITETYVENGSIYVFKPEILLKHNNRLGGKVGMYVMDRWKMHEIDDLEDLHLCEFLMKTKILTPDLPNQIKKIAEQYHERICSSTLTMGGQKCPCCFNETGTTTTIEHDSQDYSKDLKLCIDCWQKGHIGKKIILKK